MAYGTTAPRRDPRYYARQYSTEDLELLRFNGPGLGDIFTGDREMRCNQPDAVTILRMLEAAYEAGQTARSVEIRRLLGAP